MEEDPGLMTLIQDILSLVYFLVYAINGFLMLSYLAGKNIVHWSCWLGLGIWDGFCATAEGLKLVFDAIIEFEESLIRGAAVVHYGIGKIFDAFELTLLDLMDFLYRFQMTIRNLLISTFGGFGSALSLVFITVPQHICTALAIIGDFALEVTYNLYLIVQDFLIQILWSPINVLLHLYGLAIRVATLPAKALATIPFSTHVGSIVILLFYVLYCKLSFFRLVTVLLKFVKAVHRIVKRTPDFLIQIGRLLSLSRLRETFSDGEVLRGDLKGVCVICHENVVSYLANPCNHVCLCERCVRMMMEHDDRCPMCRKRVNHYSKVYVS